MKLMSKSFNDVLKKKIMPEYSHIMKYSDVILYTRTCIILNKLIYFIKNTNIKNRKEVELWGFNKQTLVIYLN